MDRVIISEEYVMFSRFCECFFSGSANTMVEFSCRTNGLRDFVIRNAFIDATVDRHQQVIWKV